jgi:hypothetical protein
VELGHGLVETPSQEVRHAYNTQRYTDAGAGAEPH